MFDQTRATERFFSDSAAHWSRNYAGGGGMRSRIPRFLEPLQTIFPNSGGIDVLDFGCGSGELSAALVAAGFSTSACDVSPAMLAVATQNPACTRVFFRRVVEPPRAPFEDGCFDAVVASSVLEYCADPLAQLVELARLLRPGGTLLCTVPDLRDPIRALERKKLAVIRAPIIRGAVPLLPRRVRRRLGIDYLRLSVSRPELEQWSAWLRRAGLSPHNVHEHSGPLALFRADKPAAG